MTHHPTTPPHPQVHQDVLPSALLDAVTKFVIDYSKRPGSGEGQQITCYAPLNNPKHTPRNAVEEVVAYLAESIVRPEVQWEGIDWWVQVRPVQSPKVCRDVPRRAAPCCAVQRPAPTPSPPSALAITIQHVHDIHST